MCGSNLALKGGHLNQTSLADRFARGSPCNKTSKCWVLESRLYLCGHGNVVVTLTTKSIENVHDTHRYGSKE